jgi:microcystin-dependent protein
MIDDVFYTKSEAYALFRGIFVGVIETFPFLPAAPWLQCDGKIYNMADHPVLGAKLGSTYGGNGTTTFGVPDHRGFVTAGLDNMGGTSANRLTNQSGGVNGDVLGAAGGVETHALTVAQIAAHQHSVSGTALGAGGHNHAVVAVNQAAGGSSGFEVNSSKTAIGGSTEAVGDHQHTITGTAASVGSNQPHNNVQPTIIQYRCILSA